ncbi:hypothetical protein FS749_004779 [Ceratobasidium sp. UAMH 11750]|nr:hypothetical protein FS749_004779 [Ceratobasidium sp. UAMH 11750]
MENIIQHASIQPINVWCWFVQRVLRNLHILVAMALVETHINYFTPPLDGSKPFRWINSTFTGEGPRQNYDTSAFPARVENVRGREKSSEFSLDVTGFEFHESPTAVEDFGNETLIRSKLTMTSASRTSRPSPELQEL